MATQKKQTQGRKVEGKKPTTATSKRRPSKKVKTQKKQPLHRRVVANIKAKVGALNDRRKLFLNRRPHRSFRKTARRDYVRSLNMPGYFSFTIYVTKTLWRHKATFVLLGVVFATLTVLTQIAGSQAVYDQIRSIVDATSTEDQVGSGVVGELGKAGLIFATATTQGLTGQLDSGQQIFAALMGLYIWLTTVWLLRNFLADKKVKLRDGLYSAGAPLLSTLITFLILLVQLIPMALAIIGAMAAWQSLDISGAASMLLAIGLLLIVVLSLYWVTSTFIALVVVTLPGMYPFRAIAAAGDLVIGRRLRILYRMIWLAVTIVSWWVVIVIPFILLDGWIKSMFEGLQWLPIVPGIFLVMTTFTIVWSATYIYLLYRKVVEDDASPA